jgi:hypothetical protein
VPLLAIAEAGGGDWKKAAWQAALAIEAVADTFDPSIGVELLRAVKAAFDAREKSEGPITLANKDRISSAGLVAELIADQTAPWATYNKGKPISQRQVAGLLKPYGIKPGTSVRRWNPRWHHPQGLFAAILRGCVWPLLYPFFVPGPEFIRHRRHIVDFTRQSSVTSSVTSTCL